MSYALRGICLAFVAVCASWSCANPPPGMAVSTALVDDGGLPAPPVVTGPGVETANRVVFLSWPGDVRTAYYRVRITRDYVPVDGFDLAKTRETQVRLELPESDRDSGRYYRAQVFAYSPRGKCTYSSDLVFRLVSQTGGTATRPMVYGPHGQLVTGGDVALTWTPVPGATAYRIYAYRDGRAISPADNDGLYDGWQTAATSVRIPLTRDAAYSFNVQALAGGKPLGQASAAFEVLAR